MVRVVEFWRASSFVSSHSRNNDFQACVCSVVCQSIYAVRIAPSVSAASPVAL